MGNVMSDPNFATREDLAKLETTMVQKLSDIKTAIERVETKLDERGKSMETRLDYQDKRINRLGFRFWSMIAGIGIIIVGYIVKNI